MSDLNVMGYSRSNRDVAEVESLVGNIAIGNQWQWDNFTLGCDWLGISPHLTTLNAAYDLNGLNPNDKRDIDSNWDRVAKITSLQFARFYLGASF